MRQPAIKFFLAGTECLALVRFHCSPLFPMILDLAAALPFVWNAASGLPTKRMQHGPACASYAVTAPLRGVESALDSMWPAALTTPCGGPRSRLHVAGRAHDSMLLAALTTPCGGPRSAPCLWQTLCPPDRLFAGRALRYADRESHCDRPAPATMWLSRSRHDVAGRALRMAGARIRLVGFARISGWLDCQNPSRVRFGGASSPARCADCQSHADRPAPIRVPPLRSGSRTTWQLPASGGLRAARLPASALASTATSGTLGHAI